MAPRFQLLLLCLLLMGACTRAAASPKPAVGHARPAWTGVLPDGSGGAPLAAPDLQLFVDRDGTLHPVESDPICMRSGMRVRLHVDAEVRGESFVRATGQLAGCDYLDLAGGPDGQHGLSIDQRVERPAGYWPLRIVLFEEGIAIGRQPWRLIHIRVPSGAARARLLEGMIGADRALYSETVDVALSAANAVRYAETFGTLLAAHERGYVVPHLGGERSGGRSAFAEPGLPTDLPPPVLPSGVRIDPEGVFWLEGTTVTKLAAADVSVFLEVARADTAVVVAVPRSGTPVVLGARPLDDDPVRSWIFGVPVLPAPAGYAVPHQVPPMEGVWSPFILRKAEG
jgi:hypothetical protein